MSDTMYQAIETRFAGPTNHRGARIIVRAQAGRMTVPWDHALNSDENHRVAAEMFAQKWGWGRVKGGANARGDGYCFICIDK